MKEILSFTNTPWAQEKKIPQPLCRWVSVDLPHTHTHTRTHTSAHTHQHVDPSCAPLPLVRGPGTQDRGIYLHMHVYARTHTPTDTHRERGWALSLLHMLSQSPLCSSVLRRLSPVLWSSPKKLHMSSSSSSSQQTPCAPSTESLSSSEPNEEIRALVCLLVSLCMCAWCCCPRMGVVVFVFVCIHVVMVCMFRWHVWR